MEQPFLDSACGYVGSEHKRIGQVIRLGGGDWPNWIGQMIAANFLYTGTRPLADLYIVIRPFRGAIKQ